VPIQSMTGFSRTEGHNEKYSWVWEIKSVNAKGFDCRCRLPNGYDELEKPVRSLAGKHFRRGNLSISLRLERMQFENQYKIDEQALGAIVDQIKTIQNILPSVTPPTADGLLGLKGVMELVEQEQPTVEQKQELVTLIMHDYEQALEKMKDARNAEGIRMEEVLKSQIADISTLCEQSEKIASMQPDKIKARLEKQVRELLEQIPALPEDRLAQEAAVLMVKADVREELDRLKAHIEAAGDLMKNDGAIGRQFDFLCQEFNREANTLCSKSSDVELTRTGLELKAVIEQLREQVQNIE